MIKKFLEKKVIVGSEDPSGETGENRQLMELEYYLLEIAGDGINSNDKLTTYGLEIVKKVPGYPGEKKQFKDIFDTRNETRSLVGLLAENTVTPLSLPYILDDLLGA